MKIRPTWRSDFGELAADVADPLWVTIPSAPFRDVATGVAPRQGTSVRVAWCTEELRVLLHAFDTHPWATITERDGPLWEEEVLEVFLDPVGDARSYFEIELNPLGTVVDLVCRRNRSGYAKDFTWDCAGLRTAVRHTADGWTAELAIPFHALIAEPPRAGSQWRANFCRIDRPARSAARSDAGGPAGAERELTAWSTTGLRLFHVPERFGVLEFGDGAI